MDERRSRIQELAQELAGAASRQAHAPGAHTALRVGRQRRRRRQVGGVVVLTVTLVAGVAGLPRLHLPARTTGPPGGGATPATSGQALPPVVCDPDRPPTGTGTFVAAGRSQGIAWRVTLRERKQQTPLGPELSEQERAVMQDLLRNPLASPDILGVSGGASTAAGGTTASPSKPNGTGCRPVRTPAWSRSTVRSGI